MLPVAYVIIMRRNLVQSVYDKYKPVPVSPLAIDITLVDRRNAAIV